MSNPLIAAAINGNTDELRCLISLPHSLEDISIALRYAAQNGRADCVKLLIPGCSPSAGASYALKCAARKGHAECVRLLIPLATHLDCNEAFLDAAAHGRTACVRVFLESGTTTEYTEGLFFAVINASKECVEILYPLGDAGAVLQRVKSGYPDDDFLWTHLEERVCMDRQRALLLRKAGSGHTLPSPRKI